MTAGNDQGGFSIIEIMTVAMVLGLLSLLALPALRNARDRTIVTTFTNDIHQFSGAVQAYATAIGQYPPDATPGQADDKLKEYLPVDFMERRTPIGGQWDVDMNGAAGVTAAVGVGNMPNLDIELLVQIDFAIDDGNLVKGDFRYYPFGGGRVYRIIEE